jgi:xylan 1,4-beta-xylosidase
MTGQADADARVDWQRRIYRRLTDTTGADRRLALPAPDRVTAAGGVGHARLSWDPVPGAAGYLIERTEVPDGVPVILDHGGSDVPAVPGTLFGDTGLRDGVEYRYRIAAVAGAEYPAWAWSPPTSVETVVGEAAPVDVHVDAKSDAGRLDRVWRMVGAERLSQLLLPPTAPDVQGGHDIPSEFAAALRRARDDLGVTTVRAHAILHDDNRVVRRDESGSLRFSFDRVDAIYDRILAIGVRPVVELSFMPAALARDPGQTVFTYRGIISPPANWSEWYALVATLAGHLVERYGVEEVARWGFEVWNEPNLEVFWSGTQAEYLRLYEESARAVASVDSRLRVGGPSTAAGEWIEPLLRYAADRKVPLDFVSTHTYGNLPLDPRPSLARNGIDGVPIWWTEWGVGSTHFGPIHDGVIGAPFLLSGLAAAQGRVDALAYWVVSDHFEELGRPPRLFHNGFGLLSVGNLGKPRYWAAHLAAHLGERVLASRVEGDGADVLVQAWAAAHDDGTVDMLVWNGTVNAALLSGDPRLDRRIRLTVDGLAPGGYRVSLARIDEDHSNVVALCPTDVEWPDDTVWARLRAHDQLSEAALPDIPAGGAPARFDFPLPMPGVARIRLSPLRSHEENRP